MPLYDLCRGFVQVMYRLYIRLCRYLLGYREPVQDYGRGGYQGGVCVYFHAHSCGGIGGYKGGVPPFFAQVRISPGQSPKTCTKTPELPVNFLRKTCAALLCKIVGSLGTRFGSDLVQFGR